MDGNKKARMKRAQRMALRNGRQDRVFNGTYEEVNHADMDASDPLCTTLDNLCEVMDIWRETMKHPWQREDRAYRKELAENIQALVRLMLMDAAELEARYKENGMQKEVNHADMDAGALLGTEPDGAMGDQTVAGR